MSEEAPTFPPIDPSPYEFGIVTASYNQSLCDALLARVTEVLNFSGSPKEVIVERVPGSHEIPSLLKLMLEANDRRSVRSGRDDECELEEAWRVANRKPNPRCQIAREIARLSV